MALEVEQPTWTILSQSPNDDVAASVSEDELVMSPPPIPPLKKRGHGSSVHNSTSKSAKRPHGINKSAIHFQQTMSSTAASANGHASTSSLSHPKPTASHHSKQQSNSMEVIDIDVSFIPSHKQHPSSSHSSHVTEHPTTPPILTASQVHQTGQQNFTNNLASMLSAAFAMNGNAMQADDHLMAPEEAPKIDVISSHNTRNLSTSLLSKTRGRHRFSRRMANLMQNPVFPPRVNRTFVEGYGLDSDRVDSQSYQLDIPVKEQSRAVYPSASVVKLRLDDLFGRGSLTRGFGPLPSANAKPGIVQDEEAMDVDVEMADADEAEELPIVPPRPKHDR
ncbi:hypothetical protein C8Q75DRAFT_771963 [Abortiporus biennis]|nr:hypothetical protein C8Q75DRAFT_771963 [Abortiporus biennis]